MAPTPLSNGTLPKDLVLLVNSYLDAASLLALRRSCKFLSNDTHDKYTWRHLLLLEIPNTPQVAELAPDQSYEVLKNYITKSFKLHTSDNNTKPSSGLTSRYLHRAVNTPDGSVYLYGGAQCVNDNHRDTFGDVVKVDLTTNMSTPIAANPAGDIPVARCAASLTYHDGKMYSFGGLLGNMDFCNELWSFDVSTNTWTFQCPSGEAPEPRWGHTTVAHNDTLFIFGGSSPSLVYNDWWMLDLNKSSRYYMEWRQGTLSNVPIGRSGHSVAIHGHHMYLFGGNTHGSTLCDMWRIDLNPRADGTFACDPVDQLVSYPAATVATLLTPCA